MPDCFGADKEHLIMIPVILGSPLEREDLDTMLVSVGGQFVRMEAYFTTIPGGTCVKH